MSTVPPPIPPVQPPRTEDDAVMRALLPVGRSALAIAAGYLGLFAVLLIPAPIALLVGIGAIMSIRKSRQTPNRKYGMGRAVFGVVMGAIFTVLPGVILLPHLLK
jgi:hypothetical protein